MVVFSWSRANDYYLYFVFFFLGDHTKLFVSKQYRHAFSFPDLLPSGTALVAVYWTYAGWNSPLAMGEEIKTLKKVIPRTMIFWSSCCDAYLFTPSFYFIALLPFESIQTGKDPFFIIGQYFCENLLQIDSVAVIDWIPRRKIEFYNPITGSRIQICDVKGTNFFIEKLRHLHPRQILPCSGIWIQKYGALCMILFVKRK